MLLAKDGIFPITKDKEGKPLPCAPASGFCFPGTIQGEGKLCGVPSLFIRLAGCNLRCCWQIPDGINSPCDTAYAAYRVSEAQQLPVKYIADIIRNNSSNLNHLVITGGEPMLQANELKTLCYILKNECDFHLTIETNATIFDQEVAEFIDLFSLSPKLLSSHIDTSYPGPCIETIQAFIDYARLHKKDFQLKFVYAGDKDVDEIRELLSKLNAWKAEDILLMPLGNSVELMRINTHKALECCIRNGWRFCDRLHISLFGDKIGV